jgi:hypothetical protein
MVVSALDHCAERFDSYCRQLVDAANTLGYRFGVCGNIRLVAVVSSAGSQGL